MQNTPWITRSKSAPRLRLFCFPYAGGGTSTYRSWVDQLPKGVEVCPIHLPGREERLKEPPFTRLFPLVQVLAHVLRQYMDIPYAFFGHSMGALISFELARVLRRMRYPEPIHLFVSAHRAPQLPDMRTPLHNLPDKVLIDQLLQLGGTPTAILEHTELMNIMLPIIRADFELCETYVYQQESPLDIPITAFGGRQDTLVQPEELQPWREQTRSTFAVKMIPGDHFFVQSQQDMLLQVLTGALAVEDRIQFL